MIFSYARFAPASPAATAENTNCEVKPFREAEAEKLIQGGAVIVYHRTAGPQCIDELFAIYPDGRITGTNGVKDIEKQVAPEDVERLLTAISVDHKWFTDEIYSTYLNPCRQCFAHYIIVSYEGQEKSATGVDGTTAMPPDYAFALASIRPMLPSFARYRCSMRTFRKLNIIAIHQRKRRMNVKKFITLFLIACTFLSSACVYIVLPEDMEVIGGAGTGGEPGVWTGVVTNVSRSEAGDLHVDVDDTERYWRLEHDAGRGRQTGDAHDQRWKNHFFAIRFLSVPAGIDWLPVFKCAVTPLGKMVRLQPQPLYVECKGATAAAGSNSRSTMKVLAEFWMTMTPEANKTEGTLELNLDEVVTDLTYPIAITGGWFDPGGREPASPG